MKVMLKKEKGSAFLYLVGTAFAYLIAVEGLHGQTEEGSQLDEEEVFELNPFTIEAGDETGWNAQQTYSGSRAAERLLESPISISIIPEELLEDLGAENLMEALAYTASGATQRVNYRDDITVRGYRTGPVRDGVTYSSNAFTPLWDVARLEVIKGPQAIVLSDISNIGGVVNYVTKRPTFVRRGDIGLSIGTDQTYIAHATVSGPFAESESLAYRVTAGTHRSDGWRDGNDDVEYHQLSGSVDYIASKRLMFQFDATYNAYEAGGFNRGLIDSTTGKLVGEDLLPRDFSTHAPWSYRKVDPDIRTRGTVIFAPKENLSIRALYNYREQEYHYRISQPFPGLKAEELEMGVVETIGQRFLGYDWLTYDHNVEVDLVWDFETGIWNNRFMAGIEWGSTHRTTSLFRAELPDLVVDEPFSSRPPMPDRSNWIPFWANRIDEAESWSYYLGNNFKFMEDRLTIALSARVQNDATNDGDSKIIPRYGAVYRVNEGLSLFGQYGESFRDLVGSDLLGNPYVPEVGESTEFGVKWNLFEGQVWGTVTYFDIVVDPVVTQVIVQDPDTGETLYGNQQVGKQTNDGIESDVGFIVDAGPGTITSLATAYFADPLNAEGGQFSRAVKEKYTLLVKYDFESGALDGFYFGGGYSHVGSSPGVGFDTQPAYELYTLMAGYKADNWGIIINVDNATDVDDAIVGSEAAFSVDVYRPRFIRATLNYKW